MKIYRIKIFLAFIVGAILSSCDGIDSTYKEFLKDSDILYPGRVDSVEVYPGKERVKFSFQLSSDPKVKKLRVYWNGMQDFVEETISLEEIGQRKEILVPQINEGEYTFYFRTYDHNDRASITTEAFGRVYGDKYISNLKNRTIANISMQLNGDMLVQWDPVFNNTIWYSTIEYTDSDGKTVSVKVENEEEEVYLSGLKPGDKIQVFTTHLPENGLDGVNAQTVEYTMPEYEIEFNKANFAKVLLPGDNTSVNGDRDLSKIWDGTAANPGILHTVENAAGFAFPHHFSFDMGILAKVNNFTLWGRADTPFSGHNVRYFEVWGTDELNEPDTNTDYWENETWKSDWKMLGDYEVLKPSGGPVGTNTDADKTAWANGSNFSVPETIGKVRYIRLIIKNENWQGSNCINMGEISFFGDDR